MGKECICAIERVKGRLKGDGRMDVGLRERVEPGGLREWPHISGEDAS
jgi:hypothetical protein